MDAVYKEKFEESFQGARELNKSVLPFDFFFISCGRWLIQARDFEQRK
jgi:hypothetical protein